MVYTTVAVRGKIQRGNSPAVGRAILTPSVNTVSDMDGNVVIYGPLIGVLDQTGAFSISAPATDDINLRPQNFGYTLRFELNEGVIPSISEFALPSSQSALGIDITDILPNPADPWYVPTLQGDNVAWIAGAGAPAGATGEFRDWYLNTTNGDVYEKTGQAAWTLRGNIRGPQGIQGIQGPVGPQGDNVAWLSGAGVPAGATGDISDWYLNTNNGDVYEKTGAAVWTLRGNIRGPVGPTGPTGGVNSIETLQGDLTLAQIGAVNKAGDTLTGRLILKSLRETIVNHGAVASGATVTLDFSAATIHIVDGSAGAITIATSNGADGDSLYLRIYQSTVRAVTWPVGTKWNGGSAPTLAVGWNVISIVREGTNLMASFVGTFT